MPDEELYDEGECDDEDEDDFDNCPGCGATEDEEHQADCPFIDDWDDFDEDEFDEDDFEDDDGDDDPTV